MFLFASHHHRDRILPNIPIHLQNPTLACRRRRQSSIITLNFGSARTLDLQSPGLLARFLSVSRQPKSNAPRYVKLTARKRRQCNAREGKRETGNNLACHQLHMGTWAWIGFARISHDTRGGFRKPARETSYFLPFLDYPREAIMHIMHTCSVVRTMVWWRRVNLGLNTKKRKNEKVGRVVRVRAMYIYLRVQQTANTE